MPLRYVRPLEPAERAALRQQFKTSAGVRLVHRSQAVLLSAEGWLVPRITALLRVDQSTVHRWLDRFEVHGVAGLAIQWGTGRPPRWDEAYEALLVETVRHPPRWYGWEPSLWTCPLLADYLAQQTGIRLSAERVRVLWHPHGLRLKQPTPMMHSPDAQYHPKRVRAEMVRSTDEPTAVALDVDWAELALNPTRTQVWAPVGVPWELETPGTIRMQILFGAVNGEMGCISH